MTEIPLRVVICEDNPGLAELIDRVLDEDGRFVVVGRAADGEEVVRIVEREAPDIVLMDIGLPGRDGIDATRSIRARSRRRSARSSSIPTSRAAASAAGSSPDARRRRARRGSTRSR